MVGQQMITEARMSDRMVRKSSSAHSHMHSRHSVPFSASLIFAFMKPLSIIGETILSKFRHSD
jgi:hypothetical protein